MDVAAQPCAHPHQIPLHPPLNSDHLVPPLHTGLVEVAAQRLRAAPALGPSSVGSKADLFQADGLCLPFRDGACDGALCIAVLHHMSSVGRRRAMVAELARILRPGGRAIVSRCY